MDRFTNGQLKPYEDPQIDIPPVQSVPESSQQASVSNKPKQELAEAAAAAAAAVS